MARRERRALTPERALREHALQRSAVASGGLLLMIECRGVASKRHSAVRTAGKAPIAIQLPHGAGGGAPAQVAVHQGIEVLEAVPGSVRYSLETHGHQLLAEVIIYYSV